MKRKINYGLAVSLILLFIISSLSGASKKNIKISKTKHTARSNISRNKNSSRGWAAKINDDIISIKEFNNFYYTQNKLALRVDSNEDVDKMAKNTKKLNTQARQTLVKANYLDFLISQKLVYKKAINDKDINQNQLNTIMKLSNMTMVSQYYMGIKLKDQIEVSEAEVEQFYNENLNYFKAAPLTEAVINQIKQKIFMRNASLKSNEYIMNLKAENKVIKNIIFSKTKLPARSNISRNKNSSRGWAAKINDDIISIKEFNNFYYTQNKLALRVDSNEDVDKMAKNTENLNAQARQTLVKANYLDFLISQKLVYQKAINDKDIDQDELNTIIELSKMTTVSQYYMGIKLKDQIEVSEAEVEQFYNQNRKYFKGAPLTEAVINQVKQQIFIRKASVKSNEYIMNLLTENKVNKEGFKNYMKEQEKKKTSEGADKKKETEKKTEKKK